MLWLQFPLWLYSKTLTEGVSRMRNMEGERDGDRERKMEMETKERQRLEES